MVDDSVLRTISLYFFLIISDEKRAHTASLRALNKIKNLPASSNRATLIHILHQLKKKASKIRVQHWPQKKDEKAWVINPSFDIHVWRNFSSKADQSESESVLLSRVLGFSDAEIAEGLGVSDGTVRYRVGRGLRVLGGLAGG